MEQILLKYATLLKEKKDLKKEISDYIYKFYDSDSSENILMNTYISMYDLRNSSRSEGFELEGDFITETYDEVKGVKASIDDIKHIHDLFCRRRIIKKKIGYSKGSITKTANRLLSQNKPLS